MQVAALTRKEAGAPRERAATWVGKRWDKEKEGKKRSEQGTF
jgi:hypothetical protein